MRFLRDLLLRRKLMLVMMLSSCLTLLVAFAIRGLLRDLHVPGAWPDVGGAIWLLHPVGAESALWPSALHVPLGLLAAVWALRWYRRERYVAGTVAALAAFLSVEQTILALPLAVWLVSEGEGRRRSTAYLAERGAPSPRLDADVLRAHALGIERI